MEDEPSILLTFGEDKRIEGTRHNMTLFTFCGELCSRDHVFIQTSDVDPETKVVQGTYIFRAAEVFGQLAAFMWENDFPMHLNTNEVPECDENAYQINIDNQAQAEQPEDFFPESWLHES